MLTLMLSMSAGLTLYDRAMRDDESETPQIVDGYTTGAYVRADLTEWVFALGFKATEQPNFGSNKTIAYYEPFIIERSVKIYATYKRLCLTNYRAKSMM